MTMAWTGEEIGALAAGWFEHGGARCPRCGTGVYVKEMKDAGRATVDLAIDCRACGESAVWVNPEGAPQRWSGAEICDIVEAWRVEGEARCQADRSRLAIQELEWLGGPKELMAHCRRCGRFFRMSFPEAGARAV